MRMTVVVVFPSITFLPVVNRAIVTNIVSSGSITPSSISRHLMLPLPEPAANTTFTGTDEK